MKKSWIKRSTPDHIARWRRAARMAEIKRRQARRAEAPWASSGSGLGVNRKRKARLWIKQFHSVKRVLWIQEFPCEVTGVRCPERIHNAHVLRTRATGATYKHVVPLLDLVHDDFDVLPNDKFRTKWNRSKASVKCRWRHYQQLWEAAA